MNRNENEVIAIVDAPDVCLSEDDKAGDVLIKFYKALGWDEKTEILDPCKVRTSRSVFYRLRDLADEKCHDSVSVGALMVDRGPGTDDDIPDGKVYLLKGWTVPEKQNENTESGIIRRIELVSLNNEKPPIQILEYDSTVVIWVGCSPEIFMPKDVKTAKDVVDKFIASLMKSDYKMAE